jgi:hypothetical protein
VSFFVLPPRRDPGPPTWEFHEVGSPIALRLLLVRTSTVVVVVHRIVAYRTGATFALSARAAGGTPALVQSLFGAGSEDDESALRFGIEFADGRRATNVGIPRLDESSIALMARRGSRRGTGADWRYELRPLPPPGPLTLALEWAAAGVPFTARQIDADPIIEAGHRSAPLWST